jgi:hypothetical protein
MVRILCGERVREGARDTQETKCFTQVTLVDPIRAREDNQRRHREFLTRDLGEKV